MSQENSGLAALATSSGKLLRCNTCGETRLPSDAELLTFINRGWPHCCDETMALFVEAAKPGGVPGDVCVDGRSGIDS